MAVSKRLRYEVLRRDGHACQYCGRTAPEVKLTVDHVSPTALGGSDEPSNLVAACGDCNSGKTSSNPDAPLVESVAQDALRWSQAINVAAEQMLAQRDAFHEQLDAFDQAWSGWSHGSESDRKPVPIPDGWKWSVERFLAAGLPMPLLLDCIGKAMTTQRVKPSETFRYMCGIAWSMVGEIQEAARASAGDSQDTESSCRADPRSGEADLAREILETYFAGEESERQLAASRQRFAENGQPLEDHEIAVDAVLEALTELTWSHRLLKVAVEDLLSLLPAGEIGRYRAMAEAEAEGLTSSPDCTGQVMVSFTGFLMAHRAFKSLDEAEQDEWFGCVAASEEPSIDPELAAAQHAWRCKEHGYQPLRGNCESPGWHGAMCPARSEFKVFIQDCRICRSRYDADCKGHDVCRDHAERMVDGDAYREDGEPLVVSEVIDLAVSV